MIPIHKTLCGAIILSLTAAGTLPAADDSRQIDHGPFFSGTIKAGFPVGDNHAMKGIVVKLGPQKQAYICYDTDLLRASIAWTGDFLKFGNSQREISHPQPPEVAGQPEFGARPMPGWAQGKELSPGDFKDSRPGNHGPLPESWAEYGGLYLHGDQVILSYRVGTAEILESPGYEKLGERGLFSRSFQIEKSAEPLMLLVAAVPEGHEQLVSHRGMAGYTVLNGRSDSLILRVVDAPAGAEWVVGEGHLFLKLRALDEPARFKLMLAREHAPNPQAFGADLPGAASVPDLKQLCKGGPERWSQALVTQGSLGKNDDAYAIDVLTDPSPNPWNIKMFFGGFDFLPDGRAAICTFHGDVWVVSGIDDKLERLTWKRYATGLFQPLGLKVVDGRIYVTGRDQITRLHDLNGDGEADYYENFNNDTVVTANYHEFCMDLQTDPEGSFYYCKGAPWPPDVKSPHQGTMLKVSPDGERLEVFATGLRAPNGMCVGPNGEITVSDNQGHWMPASKLNWVERGGFYGMVQAAHRNPKPSDYAEPICWLPMNVDNSSGGQVWVTSDRWGPFQGHLLFMSYGRGTLFHVMLDKVQGELQAAMVQFPLKFRTGIMRGRVNPRDGQVYLCGLRGWQTSGVKDGEFYRVRYTGKPVHMPIEFHAGQDGVTITFTEPLDPAGAIDPENYSAQIWNYKWTGNYGSESYSVGDLEKKGRDSLAVESVRLSRDRRNVFLKIPDLKPADQVRIKFRLASADGAPVAHEIYGTIHQLGRERRDRSE